MRRSVFDSIQVQFAGQRMQRGEGTMAYFGLAQSKGANKSCLGMELALSDIQR